MLYNIFCAQNNNTSSETHEPLQDLESGEKKSHNNTSSETHEQLNDLESSETKSKQPHRVFIGCVTFFVVVICVVIFYNIGGNEQIKDNKINHNLSGTNNNINQTNGINSSDNNHVNKNSSNNDNISDSIKNNSSNNDNISDINDSINENDNTCNDSVLNLSTFNNQITYSNNFKQNTNKKQHLKNIFSSISKKTYHKQLLLNDITNSINYLHEQETTLPQKVSGVSGMCSINSSMFVALSVINNKKQWFVDKINSFIYSQEDTSQVNIAKWWYVWIKEICKCNLDIKAQYLLSFVLYIHGQNPESSTGMDGVPEHIFNNSEVNVTDISSFVSNYMIPVLLFDEVNSNFDPSVGEQFLMDKSIMHYSIYNSSPLFWFDVAHYISIFLCYLDLDSIVNKKTQLPSNILNDTVNNQISEQQSIVNDTVNSQTSERQSILHDIVTFKRLVNKNKITHKDDIFLFLTQVKQKIVDFIKKNTQLINSTIGKINIMVSNIHKKIYNQNWEKQDLKIFNFLLQDTDAAVFIEKNMTNKGELCAFLSQKLTQHTNDTQNTGEVDHYLKLCVMHSISKHILPNIQQCQKNKKFSIDCFVGYMNNKVRYFYDDNITQSMLFGAFDNKEVWVINYLINSLKNYMNFSKICHEETYLSIDLQQGNKYNLLMHYENYSYPVQAAKITQPGHFISTANMNGKTYKQDCGEVKELNNSLLEHFFYKCNYQKDSITLIAYNIDND